MNYHIMVVGCGGTGGNFVKEFARFLYSSEKSGGTDIKVTLIDGDIVEEKNISRQPFTKEDIGLNKAEAMCQAVYEVFGLSFEFYNSYIESAKTLKSICTEKDLPILIGAVDNHAARRVMHEYFETAESCIYLDSANEFSYGELVIGASLDRHMIYPDRTYYFQDILNDTSKGRSQMGCEELNRVSPQHIATNLFAANLLLANVVQILTDKRILGGIYYFDSFKGFSRFTSFKDYQEAYHEGSA